MSDDPDDKKQLVEPTHPNPDQESNPEGMEIESVSRLRETLAGEDRSQEKPPEKMGLFKRVTGALHLRRDPTRKPEQTPPFVGPVQPAAVQPDSQPGNSSNSDGLQPSGEVREPIAEETVQSSPWEGSIFDLLAQVQRGGLNHEETPEPETQPDETISEKMGFPQLPGANVLLELPSPALEEQTDSKPALPSSTSQGPINTSTLASRLWGLQDLPTDQDQLPPAERQTAPLSEENLPAEPEEGEDKRSFFDRFKSQREEKDTKPLQLNDDQVIDRINRTTGSLHAPPDLQAPGRRAKGFRDPGETKPESQGEQDGEDASRFTFFPEKGNDTTPVFPEQEANDANPIPPFFNEMFPNQPSSTEKGENATPFPQQNEGWIPPQTVSADHQDSASGFTMASPQEETFDIDQFLAVSKPSAQPEQEYTQPQEEYVWPGNNLEDIRSIALDQTAGEPVEALAASEAVIGKPEPSSASRKFPGLLKFWWASLSTFNKILLGFVVLLLIIVIAFAISIINASAARNPAIVPVIPTPTTTSSVLPHPDFLVLPGGWSFALKASALDTPLTVAGSGAWLQGSEVRRVIELPWNRQTEAVIQSFVPGDPIKLVFNDDSNLIYKFQEVLRVNTTDTSVLAGTSPSLVIILSGETSTSRWVVVALPEGTR